VARCLKPARLFNRPLVYRGHCAQSIQRINACVVECLADLENMDFSKSFQTIRLILVTANSLLA
jgi:hypothetical protein